MATFKNTLFSKKLGCDVGPIAPKVNSIANKLESKNPEIEEENIFLRMDNTLRMGIAFVSEHPKKQREKWGKKLYDMVSIFRK